MDNKFKFGEVVRVSSSKPSLKKVNSCKGVIKGMSQDETDKKWGYAVSIIEESGIVWDIMEEDLVSTGKIFKQKHDRTKEYIKVSVDPKTGEGEIIEDDNYD